MNPDHTKSKFDLNLQAVLDHQAEDQEIKQKEDAEAKRKEQEEAEAKR